MNYIRKTYFKFVKKAHFNKKKVHLQNICQGLFGLTEVD